MQVSSDKSIPNYIFAENLLLSLGVYARMSTHQFYMVMPLNYAITQQYYILSSKFVTIFCSVILFFLLFFLQVMHYVLHHHSAYYSICPPLSLSSFDTLCAVIDILLTQFKASLRLNGLMQSVYFDISLNLRQYSFFFFVYLGHI